MKRLKREHLSKKRDRKSIRRALPVAAALLVLATAMWWNPPASAAPSPIAFDFDTGAPTLSEGQNTPLDQTSGGVTAHFSSPSDPATYSVQSYGTTFLVLSQFSGKYLFDNKPSSDYLDIKFSTSVLITNLTFATIEVHGGPGTEPCYITLTAYVDSPTSTPVGSTMARGTWSSDSYPQGTLSFDSGGKPFNLVRLYMPYQRPGVTDFFVDNVVVIPTGTTPPGNLKAALIGHGAWPAHHHLAIYHRGNTQIFYGRVANIGPGPVLAKVVYQVMDATTGAPRATVHSNAMTVPVGGFVMVSGTWTATVGHYSVKAQCWFDTNNDGTFDGSDPNPKSFRFWVVW